jgi:hypothetical protein
MKTMPPFSTVRRMSAKGSPVSQRILSIGDVGSPGKAEFSESEEAAKKCGETNLIVDASLCRVSASRPYFVPLLHRCHSVRLHIQPERLNRYLSI